MSRTQISKAGGLLLCILLLAVQPARAKSLYIYKPPANIWQQALPKIVIIIDDMGNNSEQGERAVRLPGRLTYAFLPFTPAAASLAETAHQSGKEVMLHAPMSSLDHNRLGPGALVNGMDKQALQSMLRRSIRAIPHVRGVNNHMGSELTQLAQPMSWVMEELGRHKLFFVDSRTNSNSVAYQSAKSAKIPTLQRDIFLDHDPSPQAIAAAFQQTLELAQRNGLAVAIGHPYPSTLDYLETALESLDCWQVSLVFASEVLPAARGQIARSLLTEKPERKSP